MYILVIYNMVAFLHIDQDKWELDSKSVDL
jgi:hypothetical protein